MNKLIKILLPLFCLTSLIISISASTLAPLTAVSVTVPVTTAADQTKNSMLGTAESTGTASETGTAEVEIAKETTSGTKGISNIDKTGITKPVPFGYAVVSGTQSTQFAGNVILDDYVLRPGDEIAIDIWGDIKLHYKLALTQDGYMDIPKAGRVYIQGMKLKNAKLKIVKVLAQIYSAFINIDNPGTGSSIVDITIAKNLGVKLYVSGEVGNPGEITIDAASASVINALKRAGGVTQTGSLRNIIIRKLTDEKEHYFDLYNFLLDGRINTDVKYLGDGDIIYVPLKGKSVTITGSIEKPGIYELKNGENLNKLIEIAGGFSVNAIKDKIKISRINPAKGEEFLDISIANGKDVDLMTNDTVDIPVMPVKKIKDIVRVKGSGIKKQGTYEYKQGMTLEDLVNEAGGLYSDAYLDNATVLRIDKNLAQTVIKLNLNESASMKFHINPMDTIVFFSKRDTTPVRYVRISGEIANPGEYELADNMSLNELIQLSGGLKQNADYERIDIGRINKGGNTISRESIILNFYKPDDKYFPLEENDQINVQVNPSLRYRDSIITIKGKVKFPGTYHYIENEKLLSLIDRAGGFSKGIEIGKTVLNRDNITSDIYINDAIKDRNNSQNIPLKPSDIIDIEEMQPWVYIYGNGIQKPGRYVYKAEENYFYYVEMAGGYKKDFSPTSITIKTYAGKIIDARRWFWFNPEVPMDSTIEIK